MHSTQYTVRSTQYLPVPPSTYLHSSIVVSRPSTIRYPRHNSLAWRAPDNTQNCISLPCVCVCRAIHAHHHPLPCDSCPNLAPASCFMLTMPSPRQPALRSPTLDASWCVSTTCSRRRCVRASLLLESSVVSRLAPVLSSLVWRLSCRLSSVVCPLTSDGLILGVLHTAASRPLCSCTTQPAVHLAAACPLASVAGEKNDAQKRLTSTSLVVSQRRPA